MGFHLRKIFITGETGGEQRETAFERFAGAEKALAKKGYAPINPVRLYENGSGNWKWKDFLMHALDLLFECDSIYLLKDWQQSKSARLHYLVARETGIKIFFEDAEQNPLTPKTTSKTNLRQPANT